MKRNTPRRRSPTKTPPGECPAPDTPDTPATPPAPAPRRRRPPKARASSPASPEPSLGAAADKVGKNHSAVEADPISSDLERRIRTRAQGLQMKKRDVQWASKVLNDFRDNLLTFLKSSDDLPHFQTAEVFNSGSYYEMVKIHSPNEFDIMFRLQCPSRLNMEPLDGGLFYRLDLCRPTRSPAIRAFLLENERTVSASKVLDELHRVVRRFMKTYKAIDEHYYWSVNRKRPYSPAVTLSLLEVNDGEKEEVLSVDVVPALQIPEGQGWPVAIRKGPEVNNWLGKKECQKIKNSQCFFVPKRLKPHKLSAEAKEAAKESWRISFSSIEKDMIKSHGNRKTCCERPATKCCRKTCLKLLKCVIEALKECYPEKLEALCSYHGKTTFLHTLSIRYEDSLWDPQQLPACFMNLLGALEDRVRRADLPHFFVPSCNLFSSTAFPGKALVFLAGALEEQRSQGLPLLKPPAPAPARPPLDPPGDPRGPPRRASPAERPSVVAEDSPLSAGFIVKMILPFIVGVLSVTYALLWKNI